MDGNRTARWAAAAAIAFGFASAPGAAADAPLCDECKYVPCVDIRLAEARAMRTMYEEVSRTAKTMDEYDRLVKERSDGILAEHLKRMLEHAACKSNLPELRGGPATPEYRRWALLGWGIYEVDGEYSVSTPAETRLNTCKAREEQLAKLREISACLDLALATEAHERRHEKQCQAGKPESPKDYALYEVGGYDAAIKSLRATQRRLQKKCNPQPQRTIDAGPAAKKLREKAVEGAAKRVKMFNAAAGR